MGPARFPFKCDHRSAVGCRTHVVAAKTRELVHLLNRIEAASQIDIASSISTARASQSALAIAPGKQELMRRARWKLRETTRPATRLLPPFLLGPPG